MAVAPHAGALVETNYISDKLLPKLVAPHAGALVETIHAKIISIAHKSRLTQAR